MTGVVGAVRGAVDGDCLVGRCRKEGCTVSLGGAPRNRLVVDFDKPGSPLGPDQARCDYLFVAEAAGRALVGLIEVKKGRIDASEARRQLQAGARGAEPLVPSCRSIVFRPILVSGGGMRRAERTAMRRAYVSFHGRREPLRRMACKARLMSAFAP
ncbi:MAG: hypothetical protein F4X92_09805 [Gammaproteobacteria bacterium]|nr:hypothetical protein [Gammaproteobacteria bacterium]